ncbi:MAG TPA: hypothetical protein VN799_04580 [Acidimicrobiales bacterium]|nr:hypothetical protein [Acidimicrobiales bacterium]
MRGFVGRAVRTIVVSIAFGVALRIAQEILGRRSGDRRPAPIRTGSFDSWPAVPPAPGRPATGA